MSCYSLKKLVAAVSRVVACSMLLAGMLKPACAEAPEEGVIRTFAVEFNSALDFLSEQSVGLVVAPADSDEGTTFLEFADSNSDERFNSTVWQHRHAMHISVGGAEIPGYVVWLLTPDTPTPPPTGAITFTGAGSPYVCSQELIYIQPCDPLTCGIGSFGKVHVGTPASNASKLMVVTAVFSR